MKKIFSVVFIVLFTFFMSNINFSQDYAPVEKNSQNILKFNNSQDILKTENQNDNNRAIITVNPSNNSSSGNGRAPQGSRVFINTKYILSSAEMTASGFGVNAVTSVGWRWNNPAGAGAPVAQSVPTTGNLRVYMKDTVGSATTIGSTFIDTLGGGYTKVIDGTISIPATVNEIFIDVPVGGPGTAPYTPAAGSSVLIIFVYKTTTTIATPLGAPTCATGNLPANSLSTYQSQTAGGSVGVFSGFRPETRLGNSGVDIASVNNIYALGKVPTPWGCPDTICYRIQRLIVDPNPFQIRVRIINRNPFPGNVKWDTTFQFNPGNPNPFDTILPINRPWNYNGWKKDSIIVEVLPVPGETIIGNNILSYNSMVTCDAWNWAEDDVPPDGGVGFTGAVGNFVACFENKCPTPTPLWAVDLCFLALTGNQPYQIKIFGDNLGQPGPVMYNSDTLTSPPGGPVAVRIQQPLPNVMIPPNSKFYVGITQLGIVNIGYCFQNEDPVKTGRFFFSTETAGVGPWNDFGLAGAPFRLDICPRTLSRVNLTTYMEGFYDGITMIPDTARLFARASTSPYGIVDSAKNTVMSNGMSWFEFCRIECNVPYYFEFRHRNHIRTWTSSAINYDCELPYNFTTNITQAFGNNMTFVSADANTGPGGYAFFTSDVNQDDVVDVSDCGLIDNDAFNFVSGYVSTDVNGDMVTDLTDLGYCDNNAGNFVSAITP